MKRYYVNGVRGWSITPDAKSGRKTGNLVSFTVLDRCWNHRVVASFYAYPNARPEHVRFDRAVAECARLNALDREWWREAA